MIIVFKGHECDDTQVAMLYEAEGNVDTNKIDSEIQAIQQDEDWEDADYEEIIEEAFNRLGIVAKELPYSEIQM